MFEADESFSAEETDLDRTGVTAMMLMWILPLLVIAWAFTAMSSRPHTIPGYGPAQPVESDPAVGIVRERYARGEIDKAQFEQLVAELLGRS